MTGKEPFGKDMRVKKPNQYLFSTFIGITWQTGSRVFFFLSNIKELNRFDNYGLDLTIKNIFKNYTWDGVILKKAGPLSS